MESLCVNFEKVTNIFKLFNISIVRMLFSILQKKVTLLSARSSVVTIFFKSYKAKSYNGFQYISEKTEGIKRLRSKRKHNYPN